MSTLWCYLRVTNSVGKCHGIDVDIEEIVFQGLDDSLGAYLSIVEHLDTKGDSLCGLHRLRRSIEAIILGDTAWLDAIQ